MSNTEAITINANPTKELFIFMLVKDIDLIRAIPDLVDNCVDGALRISKKKDFGGYCVEIEFDENKFKIQDNCGGIPIDLAKNYAFRFGRPEKMNLTPHSIGQFGVGMKRALFKLGKKFTIESKTASEHFLVEIDIEQWKRKPKWEFELKRIESKDSPNNLTACGTVIVVNKLYQNISDTFKLETFKTKLAEELTSANVLHIEKKLEIILNDIALGLKPLQVIKTKKIEPSYKTMEFKYDNSKKVNVDIYAGISDPSPEEAGWYIFCNGRLVLEASQSNITGWGENKGKTVPKYHNDYARFRGFVLFKSKYASLLPWNTTKTGVDSDSQIYMAVKQQMIKEMVNVFTFLRMLSKEKKEDVERKFLHNEIKSAQQVDVICLKLKEGTFKFPDIPSKSKIQNTRIRYEKPSEEVEEIKKVLKVRSAKAVGEKTFEYFFKHECDGEF